MRSSYEEVILDLGGPKSDNWYLIRKTGEMMKGEEGEGGGGGDKQVKREAEIGMLPL